MSAVITSIQRNKVTEIFSKPNRLVLFTKVSPSSFTIPIGTVVLSGNTAITTSAITTLDLDSDLDTGSKTAGTDYYVYAKSDSSFYISADKTITADRLIGGFHYGLTTEAEALTGNKTEADMVAIRGINKYSFWDLKFRPVSDPEGMVHIGGKWYDIYLLNSEHVANGTSKAGLTIAAGTADANGRAVPKIPLEYGGDGTVTYGAFKWFHAAEVAKANTKELISYAEFMAIAYGVDEGKSSQTNAYETVVGAIEHYPNLTSKFGIEQAAGVEYIWGADVGGNRDEGSVAWAWRDVADGRGQIYALHDNHITAVRLGGTRDNDVNAGSRASSWGGCVWYSVWNIGCRFACDHLELV